VDIKRFIIGTVVGAITLYALGYLIWELAFADWISDRCGERPAGDLGPRVRNAVLRGALNARDRDPGWFRDDRGRPQDWCDRGLSDVVQR